MDEHAWQLDLITDEFRVSATLWEELGYTPDSQPPPTREAARKLVHPRDAALAREELESHFRSEEPFELEVRARAADGEWRFLRVRGCVTERSSRGLPTAITGILADITDKVVRARKKRRAEDMIATLSARERQVLTCLLAGAPNKNMAYGMGLSQRTVEGYRARLMEKLDVKSVSELIQLALAGGIVRGDEVDCGLAG